MTYTNGVKYEGGWENDKKHGKGIRTYTNGTTRDEEWEKGDRK